VRQREAALGVEAAILVLYFDTGMLRLCLIGEEGCCLVAPLVGVPFPVHGYVYSLTGISYSDFGVELIVVWYQV
jgi:hypothetical protein